jgi:hypothetical protein
VVGRSDDGITYGCAAPTLTFAMPAHGALAISGTLAVNSVTDPFHKTVTF